MAKGNFRWYQRKYRLVNGRHDRVASFNLKLTRQRVDETVLGDHACLDQHLTQALAAGELNLKGPPQLGLADEAHVDQKLAEPLLRYQSAQNLGGIQVGGKLWAGFGSDWAANPR